MRFMTAYPGAPIHLMFSFGDAVCFDWSTSTEAGTEHSVSLNVWSDYKGRKEVFEIVHAIETKHPDTANQSSRPRSCQFDPRIHGTLERYQGGIIPRPRQSEGRHRTQLTSRKGKSMVAQKGKDLLLKLDADGKRILPPFAGLRARQISLNAENS